MFAIGQDLPPRMVIMKLRKEIQNLVELGRRPSEDDAGDARLRKIEEAYSAIERPINDEEAEALLALFGDDIVTQPLFVQS